MGKGGFLDALFRKSRNRKKQEAKEIKEEKERVRNATLYVKPRYLREKNAYCVPKETLGRINNCRKSGKFGLYWLRHQDSCNILETNFPKYDIRLTHLVECPAPENTDYVSFADLQNVSTQPLSMNGLPRTRTTKVGQLTYNLEKSPISFNPESAKREETIYTLTKTNPQIITDIEEETKENDSSMKETGKGKKRQRSSRRKKCRKTRKRNYAY